MSFKHICGPELKKKKYKRKTKSVLFHNQLPAKQLLIDGLRKLSISEFDCNIYVYLNACYLSLN